MESPIEVVRRFCRAWSDNLGADDLAAFFTNDAVYHNMPLGPVTGRENIARNIDSYIRPGPPGIERIERRYRSRRPRKTCFPLAETVAANAVQTTHRSPAPRFGRGLPYQVPSQDYGFQGCLPSRRT